MYAQQRQMRYSPHNGPGYYEDQRRYQGSGYSQAGYSHAGGFSHTGYSQQGQGHGGWDHRSFVSGAHAPPGYGQAYGNRHSPVPTYGTRSPSPQWTEQQSARYHQNVNTSPAPTSARDTPYSNAETQLDNSSTIDSYDREEDYADTTYTVSEEEPAANVSCTNLLFGGGKNKAGLINCNQVDPSTTEVEVNLNMPRMDHLEKRVDQYMNQVPSSQSNLRAAVQAFHCKQEPIHTHQFAQYARYDDYETYYEEPDYIREAFQPQMMVPPTPRPPVPSQVYGSALFSEGSASTEEEENPVPAQRYQEPAPAQRYQHNRAPREIIVDNHDTVSVLSDKHLVSMGIGPSPRRQPNHGNDDILKPFSPTNRASPRTPSRSKGFKGYNETSPMQAQVVDENGLKKDSESSSLVPMYDENAPKRQDKSKFGEERLVEEPVIVQRTVYRSNDNLSFDESVEVSVFQKRTDYGRSAKKTTNEYNDNPSFDEPAPIRAKPGTKYESNDENPSFDESLEPMIRPKKKAEVLIDDHAALLSPRNHMLGERTETSSGFSRTKVETQRNKYVVDELMGKSESSEEDVLGNPREKTWDELMRAMDDKKILEDELMSKSRGKPEDELASRSMGMRGQSVVADSEKSHEMSSSVPNRDYDERVTRTPSIESNIDAILEKIDNEPYEAEEETVGEEVDYMPSTRAAASLIESMMGALTKAPLPKIAEDEDFEAGMEALNIDDDEEIKQMKKDLYRFL